MKILFDSRIFQLQQAGGINRYFAEVISGLPPEWQPLVTGTDGFGENIPKHPRLCVKNPLKFRPARFERHYLQYWWKPRATRGIRLAHPTYYDLTSGFSLSDFSCPVVTTVYDMIYALFPKQTDAAEGIRKAQRESVLRADKVVCISKSTENDLLQLIPQAAGKTAVIYLGSSFPVIEEAGASELFEQPTFLYVGFRGGYKNFLFLLRAFAKAASVVDDIRLQVVGPDLSVEERWQMHFLGITDKVSCTVYPNEAVLQELYRRSVGLLYPSRYEGFGIPPLEAMACGTIPVTANTSSLPEVMGNAGFMLEPADENTWADCIIKLARPFAERASLLEHGRARVKQFSWSECARRHVEIYRELT
ncbi:MAG TPA: glycosyltransferase family 1 protein [Candidatus Sulfotelmatobacter sp.]|jgi:glycosyltransferase involved in cell wall biosynthesis|nr:glycosyltransferase family 1 protein [Candidatus Sulfotelmatobacter sp.]